MVGTLWSRIGGVLAHPDNAYRLLREQQQLVLVFPEGSKGPGKTFNERYRLRRFGRGGFVQIAMRAGVPGDPHRRGRRRGVDADPGQPGARWPRRSGSPYAPITANMLAFGPLLGPLGALLYFPAKFKLRVLDPVHFDVPPDQPRYSRSRIMDESEAIRQQIQEALYDMLREPPLGLERLMGRRVLVTGLGTFWGGRVAKALEADPDVDVIVGLDTHEPQVELERTEYVRSDENYSILSRIVEATQVDTIVHTFLVVDSTQMRARTMHEINVIGTMNLFAAATESSVRNVVVKSSAYVYGADPRDPVWFTEETTRQAPPAPPRRAIAGRGRVLRPRLRRRQPPRGGVDAAVLQRARPRADHAALPDAPSCRWCRRCSASTPGSSSSTRTT